MSEATGEHRPEVGGNGRGVLANLPSTRPQRSSPRRTAARRTAQVKARGPGRRPAKRPRSSPASSRPKREAAPRQGFEADSESMTGSLQPPGGVELVASAAEIVGELAKAGLSTGERLLKDALARLPGG